MFTAVSRGKKLALFGFNDTISLDEGGFTNAGAKFELAQSDMSYDKGYMLKTAGSATDEDGLVYALDKTYTDDTINMSFSVRPESGATFKLRLDANNTVTISEDSVSAGGTQVVAEPGLVAGQWNTVTVTADKSNIRVIVNDKELVAATSTLSGISGFTLLASGGAYALDNILVYRMLGQELAGITYDAILGGQNKFNVTSNLTLPDTTVFDGNEINVKWSSGNDSVLRVDGTDAIVGKVDIPTKVVLTATAEEPGTGEILQTKTFDIFVSVEGSTLLYGEDFETGTENQDIDTFKEWTRNATKEWVDYKIKKDPTAKATDSFNESNKVFSINRKKVNSAEEAAPVEGAGTAIPIVYDGIVEYNFDIYYKDLSSRPLFRIINDKSAFITETYLQGKSGYFSNTSPIQGNMWQSWGATTAGKWCSYRIVVDTRDKTIRTWVNGKVVSNVVRYSQSWDTTGSFNFGSQRGSDPAIEWYVDNVVVRNLMPSDTEAVEIVGNNLTIADGVSGDMELPTKGDYATDIIWSSDDTDIITENGIVSRGADDETVTLTARILKNDAEYTRSFTVTVAAENGADGTATELISGIADKFSFAEISDESRFNVKEKLNLITTYTKGDAKRLGGVSIEWQSSDDAIDASGNVTRGSDSKCVTLTATFSAGGASATKAFKVYIPSIGQYSEFRESFDYDADLIGNSIADTGKWTVGAPSKDKAFTVASRLQRDYKDNNNKVMAVTRAAYYLADDQPATVDANMQSSDLMFNTMFMFCDETGVINISLEGVDQEIIIKKSSVKMDWKQIDMTFDINEWYKLSAYFDDTRKTFDLYIDDVKVTDQSVAYTGQTRIDSIKFLNKSADKSFDTWCIDEISVVDVSVPDDEAVDYVEKNLDILTDDMDYANGIYTVYWDIDTLPTSDKYGVKISWQSSNPTVLSNDGIVERTIGEGYDVEFTATISKGSVTKTKTFKIHVAELTGTETPTQEIFDKHVDAVSVEDLTSEDAMEITENMSLFTEYSRGNAKFYGGMDVKWQSSNPSVIDNSGNVVRQVLDVPVTLTATYTSKRDASVTKEVTYKVTVWAEGEIDYINDFESLPANAEGVENYKYDSVNYGEEARPLENIGQSQTFEKDFNDLDKTWADANKTMCIERYKQHVNGVTPAILPTRTKYWFPESYKNEEIIAFSFKIMMDAASSRADVQLIGVTGSPAIIKQTTYNERGAGYRLEAHKWHTFTYIIYQKQGYYKVLCDGKELSNGWIAYNGNQEFTGLWFDVDRSSQLSKYYIDDITVRILNGSDESVVNNEVNKLSLPVTEVYNDLDLVFEGANRTLIRYESSNPDVLSNNGEVNRQDEDTPVTLTAYVTRGGSSKSKSFELVVKRADTQRSYTVASPVLSGNKLSAVTFTRNDSLNDDAMLMVMVYNQNSLVGARCIDLSAYSGTGTHTATFNELDLTGNDMYKITTYVYKGNNYMSNVETITYKD